MYNRQLKIKIKYKLDDNYLYFIYFPSTSSRSSPPEKV